MLRKGYSDGPAGQIHWQSNLPDDVKTPHLDMYCLHPSPYSGAAFQTLLPVLGTSGRVVAPDYPGFGASSPFENAPDIADLATSMLAVVDDLSPGQKVTLLGFHTGCLVAAEMALMAPERVAGMVLIDVPAFDPETRKTYLDDLQVPFELSADLKSLQSAWDFNVSSRLDSIAIERGFELFVEQLRPGTRMNDIFRAAFSYSIESRLSAVAVPALLVATASILLEPTRRAATLMPCARLVEKRHITQAVLDAAAPEIGDLALQFCAAVKEKQASDE